MYRYNILADFSIDILDVDQGEYVITVYNQAGKQGKKQKNLIHYDNYGKSYIKKNREKYYLNEFVKVRG